MQLIVTTAGFAAIVNAENTGTDPVLIAEIGITDQVFTADAGDLVLPGELKRLTTFAGAAVADNTIHVTIRDDSADVYTLRGFALYAADGTLIALYSQAGTILEKSAQAMMLLAADCIFTQISATSLTFGDTNWINPPGTETVPGVLELATDAETATGTDNTRAVHSKGLKALLDSRFGVGSPSAFVKGLLTLSTAALIRTALELKSAALKDEGANNGLDSDLLDGQHGAYYRSYANLTGVPASFPPSAHSHLWANISDPPATATRWPAWTEVTGKPATFAPAAHTHAAADITSGTLDVARIPSLPTSQIDGLDTALAAKAPLANPAFTGTPTAPTAAAATNTTQLATTAFVVAHDDPAKANLASPTFTGTPTAPTAIPATNTTQIATTAFVHAHDDPAKANLASPAFTGTPTAPTAAAGTNTTQVATTAFVAALGALKANLASPTFTGTVTAPIFNATSSRRYKKRIETISAEHALELLAGVRLVSYELREDGSYQMGVIAEELADGPLDFAVARTANGDPEAVNYQPLFILACAALQGLAGRVAALESRG